jgi:hypothetical protein
VYGNVYTVIKPIILVLWGQHANSQ